MSTPDFRPSMARYLDIPSLYIRPNIEQKVLLQITHAPGHLDTNQKNTHFPETMDEYISSSEV